MKNQQGHFTPYLPWWFVTIIIAVPVLVFAGAGLLIMGAVRWWKGRSK